MTVFYCVTLAEAIEARKKIPLTAEWDKAVAYSCAICFRPPAMNNEKRIVVGSEGRIYCWAHALKAAMKLWGISYLSTEEFEARLRAVEEVPDLWRYVHPSSRP